MKNNLLKFVLLTLTWIASTLPALAFPDDPDDTEDPLPTPIDDWVILLVLIAVTLGIYFMMKHKKSIA